MTAISVIVPVLNGAATIERALASLVAQTWTDFEILVVNDGSTDQTAQIVAALAEKETRLRLIMLDYNHGVGFARNVGIDHATGDWIALLDADDWYDPDRLSELLSAANKLHADIVLDNMRMSSVISGCVTGSTMFGQKSTVEALTPRDLFERDTPFSPFAIGYAQPMFRTAFLRETGVRYNETYALGEDFVFLAQAVLNGAKAYILPYTGYNYTYTRPTLFSDAGEKGKINRGYHQVLIASDDLLSRFSKSISPDVRKALLRRRRLFKDLSIARDIKTLIKNRAWWQALAVMVRNPSVVPFTARMMFFRSVSPDFFGS